MEQHTITWHPLKHYWTLYHEHAPSVYALTHETSVYCMPGTTLKALGREEQDRWQDHTLGTPAL